MCFFSLLVYTISTRKNAEIKYKPILIRRIVSGDTLFEQFLTKLKLNIALPIDT